MPTSTGNTSVPDTRHIQVTEVWPFVKFSATIRVTSWPVWAVSYTHLLAAAVLGMDWRAGMRIFFRDRFNHASPNSAQTEAVCAGVLHVQLAGDAWYFGTLYKKKTIGDDKRPVEAEDIPRACRLMYGAAWAAALAAVLVLAGIRS